MAKRRPSDDTATDFFGEDLLTHEEALDLIMRMAGCDEEEAEEWLEQFASERPDGVVTEQ